MYLLFYLLLKMTSSMTAGSLVVISEAEPIFLKRLCLDLLYQTWWISACIWSQFTGLVKPWTVPHVLPHSPIRNPTQPNPHQDLPALPLEQDCHHTGDTGNIHLGQFGVEGSDLFHSVFLILWLGLSVSHSLSLWCVRCAHVCKHAFVSETGHIQKSLQAFILIVFL